MHRVVGSVNLFFSFFINLTEKKNLMEKIDILLDTFD